MKHWREKKRKPPGRPKGSKNKFSKQAAENLAKHVDMLPHEFLARVALSPSVQIKDEALNPTLNQRISAAKAAAPFFAPKLHTIKLERPQPRDMNDQEIINELKERFDTLKHKQSSDPPAS